MGPGFSRLRPPRRGDVKNLVNAPGGNDSIWIDIGAPELTTAAGLRYKMLVAPLILDLDNRVNLNVAGNILASGNGHASNQGWGPWEINMGTVLNAPAPRTNGRTSSSAIRPMALPRPMDAMVKTTCRAIRLRLRCRCRHVYAQTDFNGTQDPAPSALTAARISLPTAGNGYFPSFPAGYGNGAATLRK